MDRRRQAKRIDLLRRGYDKQEVAVLLQRGELIYDIEFATNRIAKVGQKVAEASGQEPGELPAVQSAEGSDNKDYLDRLIKEACAQVKRRTNWASGGRGSRMVTDEIPEDIEQWTFIFKLPREWRGDTSALCDLIHEYVVDHVLWKWLELTGDARSASIYDRADDMMRDIITELRKMPSRTTYFRL